MSKYKNIWILTLLISISISQESYIDSTKIKDPSIAWKLGFIPGLGQIYNGKWIKSGLLLGAQYYALDNFIRLRDKGNISMRNTYAWWVAGLYVYGILDAYVDAHLSSFPVKKKAGSDQQILPEYNSDTLKIIIE